jgi:uncharacterized protein
LKFHADSPLNNSIEATGENWVRVGGETYQHSLVVAYTGEVAPWAYQDAADLTPQAFTDLAQLAPELIILGTGARHRFIPPARFHPLIDRGIGLECMSTSAACRTYNVLISEERRVVLAILLPSALAQ